LHQSRFLSFHLCAQSPLAPGWARVLQVGDASGIQSPLSFGGFGALTRHLGRLRGAIGDALQVHCLFPLSLNCRCLFNHAGACAHACVACL
jgi:hypothetical protein